MTTYARRVLKGLCGRCGRQPITDGSRSSCARCLARIREATGFKPWRQGGSGRRPLQAAKLA